ncbi:hypothetical protein IWX87_001243 [Polaromonas sp. CG_9.7]|nr:hypothetical protein [Polaromonas sp. CG_9.7]MBG6113491.1 hypothetical protein [Polaromonas sp. CG_9.2]MDH6183051.1 hypothetical protein [Polaromonas sp. CG_23.6]
MLIEQDGMVERMLSQTLQKSIFGHLLHSWKTSD